MNLIETRRENGTIYGLLVRPQDGKLLTTEQLESLLPYVLHVVKAKASSAIANKIASKLAVSGQNLSFQDLSEVDAQHVSTLLDTVISACNSGIKEALIVPQSMGTRPTIKHRVMHFEVNDEKNGIAVKFTELGSSNNLDAAMEELAEYYPSGEVTKVSESKFTP